MEMKELRIDQIVPNPLQPREIFDKDKLKELADTIADVGVLQPILVRPKGDQYEIIAGERRWKASQIAGIKTIPALIKELPDSQVMVESLIENVHRSNLKPMEQAKAILEVFKADESSCACMMIDNRLPQKISNIREKCYGRHVDNKLTEEEVVLDSIVKKIGLSHDVVYQSLKLLSLPESLQIKATEEGVSKRHLVSISAIEDKQDQKKVFDVVVEKELSSRETIALTKVVKRAPEPVKRAVLDAKVSVEVAQTIIDAKLPDKEQEKIVHIAVDQQLSKEGTKRIATIVKTSPESVKRAVLDAKVSPEVAQTIIEIDRSDEEQEALVNVAIEQKLSKESVKRITAVVDAAPDPVKYPVMVGTLPPEMGEEITVAFADLPDEATEQVTIEVIDMVYNKRSEGYIIEHIDKRKHDAEHASDPKYGNLHVDGHSRNKHEMHANGIIRNCQYVNKIFPSLIPGMPKVHQDRAIEAILDAHRVLEGYLQFLREKDLLTEDDVDTHRSECALRLTEGMTVPSEEEVEMEYIDTDYTEV